MRKPPFRTAIESFLRDLGNRSSFNEHDFKDKTEGNKPNRLIGRPILNIARFYIAISAYKQAIDLLVRITTTERVDYKDDVRIGEAYLLLGFCYKRTGDYSKAVKSFKDGLEGNPFDSQKIRFYIELATCYLNICEIGSARRFLQECKELVKDRPGLLYFKGRILTYSLLGRCAIAQGNKYEAESYFGKVREVEKLIDGHWDLSNLEKAPILIFKIFFHLLNKDYVNVESYVREYIGISKKAANWRENYSLQDANSFDGLAKISTGDFTQGIRILESVKTKMNKCYRKDIEGVWLNYNLGKGYFSMGQFQKAIDIFKGVLSQVGEVLGKDNKFYVKCLEKLGNCYLETWKLAEAEMQYFAALKILETLEGSHLRYRGILRNNIAIVLIKRGKYKKAEKEIEKALSLVSGNFIGSLRIKSESYRLLGDCYALRKKRKAIKFYAKAQKLVLKNNPNEFNADLAKIRRKRGDAYSLVKKYRAARQAYERAISSYTSVDFESFLNDPSIERTNSAVGLIKTLKSYANSFTVGEPTIEQLEKAKELQK